MSAATAATVPTATPKSVLLHTPDELTFVTLDEAGEIAYFQSTSESKPGHRNITAIEIMTLDTFCFCKAAECGRTCWHTSHIAAAWRAIAYRVRCERMDLPTLEAHGHSLAKYVMQAEAAHQPYIAAQLRERLDTARRVWRERVTRVTPLPFPCDAAPLLAA
jgi:hypothetical protein